MFAAALIVLAQACAPGVDCAELGYQSHAGLFGGSGTPDFQCGESDPLPDGGWGSGSKYCLIETHETPGYSGAHGDLTIAAKYARYAGWLLFVNNPLYGTVLSVGFDGNVYAYGSFWAYQNGGGLRNGSSYAAVYGASASPGSIPDVVVGPMSRHYGTGFNFGVWSGYEWTLRVRDDGAVSFVEAENLKFRTNNDALCVTQELPDGGSRAVVLRWQQ